MSHLLRHSGLPPTTGVSGYDSPSMTISLWWCHAGRDGILTDETERVSCRRIKARQRHGAAVPEMLCGSEVQTMVRGTAPPALASVTPPSAPRTQRQLRRRSELLPQDRSRWQSCCCLRPTKRLTREVHAESHGFWEGCGAGAHGVAHVHCKKRVVKQLSEEGQDPAFDRFAALLG